MTDNVPTPHPEDQQDTYTDLTARLAAADLGWSHEHGDPPASPDYIKRLAFQVMAFKPPLIAGVYVDDEMLDDMRDRLHGDNCGCGEWDSHSQEYVERMDETIHAVLYPLRHPVRPVLQGTQDSPDVRERDAQDLWRCDNGNLYRWSDQGVWEGMPFSGGPWWQSSWDSPEAMAKAGLRLTAVPDALSWHVGQEVEWNPTEDNWRPGVIVDLKDGLAAVVLHGNGQRLNIEIRHLRSTTAVSPLVEQLRRARATAESISKRTDMFKQAYNRMAKHAAGLAAERDRLRLAWQSAARGRRRARVERDTARNQFLDHYNGTAGQLDRILELQDALRERTGQRDEVRAEADRLSHELGQHRRVERDAYERHRTALVAALGDVPHKSLIALIEDDVRELRADLKTRTRERDYARAELDAVGRAIECFLGVEYGTPVGSARALVERCADAESALDGLRATAVVLPEDWRQMLADGDYPEQVVDLIESWRAAPVVEFEAADSPSPVSKSSQTAAPAEAETPARPIGMVYLLDQYDRLLSAVEHIRMDTPEDRDRHARVIATFRRAAEPVRERVEGAAPLADLPHEEWRAFHKAATGVDPGAAAAAQPEPQGELDEDWCGRFADDGKHYCPEGHNTVYQMFSGGREWYCTDCGTQGTYPPAPADVGPRARLLTQPGGAAELKRQMDEHLASPGAGTEAGE